MNTQKYKILVVEDEPISQKVAIIMLEQFGYQVTATDKGKDTLNMYKDFDLIVLDIGLQDLNGIDVCKAIRNKSIKSDIPIVALTSHNYTDEIAQAGFTEFMNKPVIENLLEKKVKDCLKAKGANVYGKADDNSRTIENSNPSREDLKR